MDKSSLLKMPKPTCTSKEFNSLISKEISKEARNLLFVNEPTKERGNDHLINQCNNTMLNLSNSYIDSKPSYYSNSNSNSNAFKRGKNAPKTQYNHQPIPIVKPNAIVSNASFSFMHIDKKEMKQIKGSFVPCKIANIDRVNAFLKYPEDSPLWYINDGKRDKGSSYGPFSTKEIKNLYSEQQIDGDTKIRPLDLFKGRNREGIMFVYLKDINNENFFIENYEINKEMIDLIDSFKKLKHIEEPVTVKKEDKDKSKMIIPIQSSETKTKEVSQPNKEEKSIKEIGMVERKENVVKEINNNKDILIEEEKTEEEKPITSNQGPIRECNNKKKKGKGPRGKPIDADVKVGFYTMSHQEKNYTPMYICGQSDQINNVPKENR